MSAMPAALATPVEASRYARCVDASRRIRWEIDRDVIRGRQFDASARASTPRPVGHDADGCLGIELDFRLERGAKHAVEEIDHEDLLPVSVEHELLALGKAGDPLVAGKARLVGEKHRRQQRPESAS